jgi:hypothetical protein
MAHLTRPRIAPNSPKPGKPGPETPQQSMTAVSSGNRGTDSAAVVSRSWKVGERTVTLTIPRPSAGRPLFATAEWAPSEPARLNTEEWTAYRLGRHQAIAELAAELGIGIAVLEL